MSLLRIPNRTAAMIHGIEVFQVFGREGARSFFSSSTGFRYRSRQSHRFPPDKTSQAASGIYQSRPYSCQDSAISSRRQLSDDDDVVVSRMLVLLLGLSGSVNFRFSLIAASAWILSSWIVGWMRVHFSTKEVDCEGYWERIGKDHCGLDLPVFALEKRARIFLGLYVLLGERMHIEKNKTIGKKGATPDSVMLSVSEGFWLCCSLICPCCSSKSNDISEDPVLRGGSTSLDSFELRSNSGKTPVTPSRVPPSPSRFSLSPQPNKLEPLNLSLNEIIKLTRNFSSSQIIGEGSFATVYKAELPSGQFIAIKRAKKEHIATIEAEFKNEVELLTKIEHKNLVRLLGYTAKGNELIIITEYVPNGNLREHLDGKYGKILDFSQRLEIAIDVAHGLTYLHLYAEKIVIHRDVKSSNILLNEGFGAKVADFGFARTGPMEADQTHIQTKVKGTAGYVDPEYLKTFRLTVKSDVYSFGILLLEILSARRPVEIRRNPDERISVRWAFNKYNEGNEREILDPEMREVVEDLVVKKIFALAFQCAAPTRRDRPAMREVVEQLWEIRKDYARSRQRS
ncbi:calmodulin-binding receptor-like cytoplasmic kinase 3 isoform X1 [Zingiber officinale]|uniref:calmodulin-binding receptor-like cytoplasmic kinase 3 isoform X1 n=3 Tax=Zingiber officinale TaxID=94328 RepID=UPI001C4B10F0|nr:calmodulin-binding receptor-like cytoplasmic kinase 3 isoform X1 [Zingiber officinale]